MDNVNMINKTFKNNLPVNGYIENYETITIPANSDVVIENINESYHPYYEVYTYRISVKFNDTSATITCKKVAGSKSVIVDGVQKENWRETFTWKDVFSQDFPS